MKQNLLLWPFSWISLVSLLVYLSCWVPGLILGMCLFYAVYLPTALVLQEKSACRDRGKHCQLQRYPSFCFSSSEASFRWKYLARLLLWWHYPLQKTRAMYCRVLVVSDLTSEPSQSSLICARQDKFRLNTQTYLSLFARRLSTTR